MQVQLTRQGDILFIPISQTDAEKLVSGNGSGTRVIARGRHVHQIAADDAEKATLYEAADSNTGWAKTIRYIEVREPVQIVHEEHAAVTLPADIDGVGRNCSAWYKINRAREFDVMSQFPRTVID